MPKITFSGLTETIDGIEKMSFIPEHIITDMLTAGAKVIKDRQRFEILKRGLVDTGQMFENVKVSDPKIGRENAAIFIMPTGKRRERKYTNNTVATLVEIGARGIIKGIGLMAIATENAAEPAGEAAADVYESYSNIS
ncbi:MAG: hypothetical protein FWF15_12385 [Oscillospiraceae bacterium]|nr:hypothetical protein [Oscillospiraceae bacterium]